MKKVFTSAPLPFMGQKRKFLKQFMPALKQFPHNAVYVDLFGGSGLLSHTVKTYYPEAKVVYNDFDNYSERLANIDKTNVLLSDIREILKDHPKDKIIKDDLRDKILMRVKKEDETGYVDYITLSSSILFAMNYATCFNKIEKSTLYNCVRQSNYTAEGYLDGIEVVRTDYKILFENYKNLPNVVFLVDPPYLSTDTSTYKGYWKLKDYLDVLNVLEGTNYFYFTSNKSQIVELCEWIESKSNLANPFRNSKTETMNATVNHNASYMDIMIYKLAS